MDVYSRTLSERALNQKNRGRGKTITPTPLWKNMNNIEYNKIKTKFLNLQEEIDSLYCELQDITSRLYSLCDDIYKLWNAVVPYISSADKPSENKETKPHDKDENGGV